MAATSSPRFNYIITIHNKEEMIEQVMTSVLACCHENSHVYPVLDGCTDGTETVIDRIIKASKTPITKVHVDDLHELRSINAGLRAASQEGEGYNIVLQDDVILTDPDIERKVAATYAWAGPKLGYLSFRLGANLKRSTLRSQDLTPYSDYIENAYGHGLPDAAPLLPGQFAWRDIPIKSPVCFPFFLVRKVGMLEEKLAPYAHDDTDYGIRCIEAGYRNGVLAVPFRSDIEWGGTRKKVHPSMTKIIRRNMDRVRTWHAVAITSIVNAPHELKAVNVPGITATAEERAEAESIWKKNQAELDSFAGKDTPALIRMKRAITKPFQKRQRSGESGLRPEDAPRIVTMARNAALELSMRRDRSVASRHQTAYDHDLSFSEAVRRYPNPNDLYAYMHHYFAHYCPPAVRRHRAYFSKQRRGFGEDAFHAMWWLLMKEFKPRECLEIGVYRGQVISLWALAAKTLGVPCKVHGLSPFAPVGHWNYPDKVDYLEDVKQNFRHFGLPEADLIKAYSDRKEGQEAISRQTWDLIYIDGDHDFEPALADYRLSLANLAPGGIIVFDDSSLETEYQAPSFSSAGAPGPTRVAREYAMKEMTFLGAVGHNTIFQKKD